MVLTQPVFLYGTLCDPELFRIVCGVPFDAEAATLAETRIRWVAAKNHCVPEHTDGATASGFVVTPDDEARARLDFYELGFGYTAETRTLETADGPVTAAIYVPTAQWLLGDMWSLEGWQTEHGALTRLAAREFIELRHTHSAEAAARAFPQVRMRAASRLRAGVEPSPEPMAPFMANRAARPERTAQPYTDYFAVREDWLAFPRFNGTDSALVKRASFLGGDAVTVLPYDTALDAVLMVRQFRHGPFTRGDTNPWTLEPAAGRIDPGETPEQTARRELAEETGVTATALHFVSRYYPSPGAYSEYLYSYVAIADLSGTDGGVGGLEDEAEDIMRHVVPLEEALAMIATGAANTGPLVLSLAWLALNKAQLR